MPKGHKRKSGRQVRYLFSSGSPLTQSEKDKLAHEIDTGAVTIKGGKKQIARQPRKHARVRKVGKRRYRVT